MNRRAETIGIVAVVLLVIGLLAFQYLPSQDSAGPPDSVEATDFDFRSDGNGDDDFESDADTGSDTIETEIIYDRVIDVADLPPEAIDTLLLIDTDGPYPYSKDGSTFQNREGRLPDRGGGYYQEFTVETPGLSHRGAKRIVSGGDGELYWTSDHYDSFAQIVGGDMWTEPLHSLAGGVLWADADTDLDALLGELDDTWITAHCSVEPTATKASLIEAIGSELGFPEWAGHNLDALYDLLTDLSWLDDDRHLMVVLDRGSATTADPDSSAIDGWQQIVQVMIDTATWWLPQPRIFIAVLR